MVIKVTKSGDNHIVDVEAAKDIPLESLGGFRLQFHRFGQFDDGTPKQSFVTVPIDGPIKKSQKLSARQKSAIDTLRTLAQDKGITPPKPSIPKGVKVAKLEDWREAMTKRSLLGTESSERSNWFRLKDQLLSKNLIEIHEEFVWLL